MSGPAWRLADRGARPEGTVVRLANGLAIGGEEVVVMAGPCAVEGEAQVVGLALAVREAGATVLRGGAFKPRSSPYAFQGLGIEGLRLLARARAESGLPVVTEALDEASLGPVAEMADIVQIGARQMHNGSLLRAAGRCGRPVLLKRGFAATIEEWLLAAEYVLSEGNPDVILCERGVRAFGTDTRFLLDLAAVPLVRQLTHLPVIVDPSHGTGRRDLVRPMARAAVAAGADGLLLEVHGTPDAAQSDARQSIEPAEFRRLVREVQGVAVAVGRRLAVPRPVGGAA
ncbi:MAG: 3-deoxy-7-phosphoheptulonate synthase [Gemmatimonadales bacterium]|nr:3-deoxy-7-phosphoheptulonate synthase [Gemmatimonadales bacterium]